MLISLTVNLGFYVRLVALDLVRFFAAMSVVIYHYTATSSGYISQVTQFGYLGVPIFFMISGYVITLSAHNRTAVQFAISRFTRLYPAYWASMVFTVITVVILTDYTYSIKRILANLTLLNSYLRIENIDGIYWTLQKELQFYFCIFLLIAFNVFLKVRIWLTIWLFITVTFLLFKQPFFMGWFISPEYSSFFIAGICFYLIQKEGLNLYNITLLIASFVLSGISTVNEAPGFMKNPEQIEIAIAVLIMGLSYILFYLLVTNKLTVKSSQFYLTLGALTYPLYLTHNLAGRAIMKEPLSFLPKELATIITIFIMIGISYLIHISIEKRIATPLKYYLLRITNIFNLFKTNNINTPANEKK